MIKNFFSSSGLDKSGTVATGSANRWLLCIAALSSMTVATGLSAQEAASLKLGETELFPTLRVDYLSIDNLYRRTVNEVSGTGVVVRPQLLWRADRRLLTLNAQYFGEFGSYSEDGLDYNDHAFRLQGVGELTSKQRLVTSLAFRKSTEAQGTGQASAVADLLDEQIEISSISAQAEYDYGARNALGNLRGGLLINSVSYSNLEQFTDGDDYSTIRPYGVFSLRISADTRLLAEVRFAKLDFDDDLRDRNQFSLLTGVEMSASSKLSGDARIGMVKASFDENSDADTTELIVEVGLDYNPLSYSRFSFSVDRSLETEDQSSVNAGRSVVDDANVVWVHDWSSRYQTQATVSFLNKDRECPRNDSQTIGVEFELNYNVRRWLQMGINGAQASRTTSDCDNSTENLEELDYDRTSIGAHIRATL